MSDLCVEQYLDDRIKKLKEERKPACKSRTELAYNGGKIAELKRLKQVKT